MLELPIKNFHKKVLSTEYFKIGNLYECLMTTQQYFTIENELDFCRYEKDQYIKKSEIIMFLNVYEINWHNWNYLFYIRIAFTVFHNNQIKSLFWTNPSFTFIEIEKQIKDFFIEK
jgi:hypothetical protein